MKLHELRPEEAPEKESYAEAVVTVQAEVILQDEAKRVRMPGPGGGVRPTFEGGHTPLFRRIPKEASIIPSKKYIMR